MSFTFFEQRRRLLARQREMEEVNRDQVIETVTEGETTEDSKPKKTVKGKE